MTKECGLNKVQILIYVIKRKRRNLTVSVAPGVGAAALKGLGG